MSSSMLREEVEGNYRAIKVRYNIQNSIISCSCRLAMYRTESCLPSCLASVQ